MRHLKGNPIVPFLHDSSLGCAICDPVIALWCLGGGRTPRELVGAVRARRAGRVERARGARGACGACVEPAEAMGSAENVLPARR